MVSLSWLSVKYNSPEIIHQADGFWFFLHFNDMERFYLCYYFNKVDIWQQRYLDLFHIEKEGKLSSENHTKPIIYCYRWYFDLLCIFCVLVFHSWFPDTSTLKCHTHTTQQKLTPCAHNHRSTPRIRFVRIYERWAQIRRSWLTRKNHITTVPRCYCKVSNVYSYGFSHRLQYVQQ